MRTDPLKLSFWNILAAVLMALFAIQVVGGMWNNAATYDEVAHLPAGYGYVKNGDFRYNIEHPPLIKTLAALPLLLMPIPPVEENPYWDSKDEWLFGRYFLYSSGIDADRAILFGRLMILPLGLMLAFLVFRWSKDLYGTKAAVFTLFLFAFEPNLIANCQLIHTDFGSSLFMLSSLYCLWKSVEESSIFKLILAALSFGLALATKFTALPLYPILIATMIFHLFGRKKKTSFKIPFLTAQGGKFSKHPFLDVLLAGFLLPVIGLLVLAASYYFSSIHQYFNGLQAAFNHNAKGNPAFLIGMYSDFGWWYYFPVALLIKTPIPITIIFFFSLFLLLKQSIRKKRRKVPQQEAKKRDNLEVGPALDKEIFLILPAFLFFFLGLWSNINYGLRHILPIYPLIIILCGRVPYHFFAAERKERKYAGTLLLSVLMLWMLSSSIFIFPYHLSYFNELVLGPKHGYKYLVDSNLDWGQDLIRLKHFLKREGEQSAILCYFGSADPNYYGIKYQYLTGAGLNDRQEYEVDFQNKEFLAISATNLQSVYYNLHDTFDWLKKKKPYARIGYSIFVWEISEDASAHRNLHRLYKDFGIDDLSLKHLKKYKSLMKENVSSHSNLKTAMIISENRP